MKDLKKRGLFFLDSRTSPRSLAFDTAYRFNIPAASRDVFIDARKDRDFIRKQITGLVEKAHRKGRAIAIGHPYRNTLDVLEEMREELIDSGVEWVPVSHLLLRGDERVASKVPAPE